MTLNFKDSFLVVFLGSVCVIAGCQTTSKSQEARPASQVVTVSQSELDNYRRYVSAAQATNNKSDFIKLFNDMTRECNGFGRSDPARRDRCHQAKQEIYRLGVQRGFVEDTSGYKPPNLDIVNEDFWINLGAAAIEGLANAPATPNISGPGACGKPGTNAYVIAVSNGLC